jgi:NadR type nicotinamide-nucleotide adenylyltransferase
MKPVRIAVTGPESTGKSMLAQALAKHYHASWIPEYAREYIDRLDRPYDQDDILLIAQGQLEQENRAIALADRIIFADTELIVTKIWSDVKYGHCDPWILENIDSRPYDLYLLCYIDIPWEADPQREHPHMRQYLFDLYFKELTDRGLPFAVIKGLGEARLQNAVKAVDDLLLGSNF